MKSTLTYHMEQTLRFYGTPGPYTDPGEFRQLLQSLPDDHEQIIRFIKMLLIHPLDARDSNVRFNYKKVLRSGVDYRSIDDILANPQVHALLKLGQLDLRSDPAQRGILSCDHHAAFFASILRLKGKAVRARCGYATYLVPDMLTPHWICEVYNQTKQRWEAIDPERFKTKLAKGAFLPAGKVWLDVQRSVLHLDQVLPDYRSGLDGIKYRLLNDVNALMKNELLNYDWMLRQVRAPRLFSKPVSNLDEGERIFLDILATLSLDSDARWGELCDQYTSYVHPENLRTAG
ncbi:MAG TPA: hypothetical protein VHP14_24645 [Anaerolineales bacterium]|nr:hypothetical protein [Anaerolineales bacterium]